MAFAFLLLSLSIAIKSLATLPCVNASGFLSNTQYCYAFSVNVANSSQSGNSYFDFPVRTQLPLDSWAVNGYIDKANNSTGSLTQRKAWDINAYQGNNQNQFPVIASNLTTSGTNPVYLVQPFIENGVTTTTFYNTGNAQAKRDQGIYFYNPNDTASFVDCENLTNPCATNPIDYIINFKIQATVKPLNSSVDYVADPTITIPTGESNLIWCDTSVADPCYADIVDKFDELNSTGYRLRVKTDSNGSSYLVCQVDNNIKENILLNYAKNSTQNILYTFTLNMAGNTQIECNILYQDLLLGTSSVVTSSLTGSTYQATQNNENINVCTNCSKVMLYDLMFADNTTGLQNVRYMFNAREISETSTGGAPYTMQAFESTNTYLDSNNTNIPLVWTINTTNTQNDMSPSVTSIQAQSISDVPIEFQDSVAWVPNWYGSGNPISLTKTDRAENSFLYWLYGKPTNWDIPDNFYYVMIFLSIGSIFAMIMFLATKEVFLSTLILGAPLLFGITQGLVPLWLGFFWFIAVITVITGKSYFRGI